MLSMSEAKQSMRVILGELLTADHFVNGFDSRIKELAIGGYDHLVKTTHVDTGAYRSAQTIQLVSYKRGSHVQYRLSVRAVRNPKHGKSTTYYAPIEEGRGFPHNAYAQTFEALSRVAAKEFPASGGFAISGGMITQQDGNG